jgi:hypothetical protein
MTGTKGWETASEPRHHDVGHHSVHRCSLPTKHFQRLRTVVRSCHTVSGVRQHSGSEAADDVLVIHDQDMGALLGNRLSDVHNRSFHPAFARHLSAFAWSGVGGVQTSGQGNPVVGPAASRKVTHRQRTCEVLPMVEQSSTRSG